MYVRERFLHLKNVSFSLINVGFYNPSLLGTSVLVRICSHLEILPLFLKVFKMRLLEREVFTGTKNVSFSLINVGFYNPSLSGTSVLARNRSHLETPPPPFSSRFLKCVC